MSDLFQLSCCQFATFVEFVDDHSSNPVGHLAFSSRCPELPSMLIVPPELTSPFDSLPPHVGSRVLPHCVEPCSKRLHRRITKVLILSVLSSLYETRMARSLSLLAITFRSSLTLYITLTKENTSDNPEWSGPLWAP